ncbi:hypothetical protein RSAG8_09509, partial [Rhizoctonia solani AG-8 WAC10335]
MAWNFELMDSQQQLDEPRRSRRTASAQLVAPKPPCPVPRPGIAPGDLESPLSPPSESSTPSQSATFPNRTR